MSSINMDLQSDTSHLGSVQEVDAGAKGGRVVAQLFGQGYDVTQAKWKIKDEVCLSVSNFYPGVAQTG